MYEPASVIVDEGPESGENGATRGSAREMESDAPMHPIPQLRVEVEAGTGAVAYEADELEVTETEWLAETFIRREYGVPPQRVRTLPVRGDSMVRTIMPGDRVRVALWDGEPMWERKIYVLRGPLGLTIKRWNVRGDNIELQADNPEVEGYTITPEDWEDKWTVVAWLLEVIKPL